MTDAMIVFEIGIGAIGRDRREGKIEGAGEMIEIDGVGEMMIDEGRGVEGGGMTGREMAEERGVEREREVSLDE